LFQWKGNIMHKSIRLLIGGSVLVLGTCFFITVSAQMDDFDITPTDEQSPGDGPVGTTDETHSDGSDPEDLLPEWENLDEDTWGPAARVDEYLPHDACEGCFTLPEYSPYTVNEYVESDADDGAVIIMREIPNPAPEIKKRTDYDPEIGGYLDAETGEEVWFIGTQEFVGPTDEEKWSPDLPFSTIKMKRIKARHLDEIFAIPGVTSFGIGTEGFVVDLMVDYKDESLDLIPDTLEGADVAVRLTNSLTVLTTHLERLRPVPAGVSVGLAGYSGGTLGPHAVRDEDTASNDTCCQLLSITAGHVVNPWNDTTSWRNRWAYSPSFPTVPRNRIGTVDFAFTQRSCGTLRENPPNPILQIPRECRGTLGRYVNSTLWRPDIGLISYGWQSVPFNSPTGAEPVRRMQYQPKKSVRGPSGRTRTPEKGHKHKVWGSRTQAASTGKVTRVDICENVVRSYTPGAPVYRYCGINAMDNYRTVQGDSGALVAYKGEGAHYLAGVQFASKITDDLVGTFYTPIEHVEEALRRAGRPISHFWGTYPGYRRPATDDGSD
jgi:hypothetical protein